MTDSSSTREAWDNILQDLRSNAISYFPQCGSIEKIVLLKVEKRVHCEIGEVRIFGASEQACLIVKLLSDPREPRAALVEKAQRELNNIRCYEELLVGSPYKVLRSIGDFSRYHALVTEKVDGLPLKELIKTYARVPHCRAWGSQLERYCEEAGGWLSWIHKRSFIGTSNLHWANNLMEDLNARLEQCAHLGLDSEIINPILCVAQQILDRERRFDCPMVVAHNDFTPENIIVARAGIVVLDYQAVEKESNPYTDIALFLLYLESFRKYPIYPKKYLTSLENSFLRGYQQHCLSHDILKIFKINALLTLYSYVQLPSRMLSINKYIRHYAYRRFINRWLRKLLSSVGGKPSGSL